MCVCVCGLVAASGQRRRKHRFYGDLQPRAYLLRFCVRHRFQNTPLRPPREHPHTELCVCVYVCCSSAFRLQRMHPPNKPLLPSIGAGFAMSFYDIVHSFWGWSGGGSPCNAASRCTCIRIRCAFTCVCVLVGSRASSFRASHVIRSLFLRCALLKTSHRAQISTTTTTKRTHMTGIYECVCVAHTVQSSELIGLSLCVCVCVLQTIPHLYMGTAYTHTQSTDITRAYCTHNVRASLLHTHTHTRIQAAMITSKAHVQCAFRAV